MIGADLASLRELAKSASLSGQELAATATSLQSAVTGTRWSGFDADSFRSRWASNIRPTLNTASASLENMSKQLFSQADAQEAASSATGGNAAAGGGAGGSGSSGAGGSGTAGGGTGSGVPGNGHVEDSNGWADAFTDPDYEHAPGGLEWGFESVFGEDGAEFQGITNGLKFAADNFDFDVGLANADELAAMMPKFSKFMDVAGGSLTMLGGIFGLMDVASGIANEDPFRVADGGVSTALAGLAIAATATGVGAPVGAAIGVVSLVWGFASLASGDVPVTKRVWDAGAAVVGGVQDAGAAVADGVQDALGWVGGKLGFG